MRIILSILLLFSVSYSRADESSVRNLRNMMADAYHDKAAARKFYETTSNYTNQSPPLLYGFRAVSELMMCNHVSGPLTKLRYFNRGKDMLEEAIKKDTTQPELRFMRFCTQVNTPALLNYSQYIGSDKRFLIAYLSNKPVRDKELYENVRKFLQESGTCTPAELKFLKSL